MAIDVDAVWKWPFPELRQTYTARDTILYGLVLGYGNDPGNAAELRFVYERDLLAMPTMAVILCHPGFWISDPATGIDARKAVHGEQHCTFHRAMQPSGSVVSRTRLRGIIDKGRDKGALVITERVLVDAETGVPIATLEQKTLCRGDGGFEEATPAILNDDRQSQTRAATTNDPASAPPDHIVHLPTSPRAALLYRLSADPNPLHADPEVARAAGFPRPILHGLCSYGIAARALVHACCGGDPHALKAFGRSFFGAYVSRGNATYRNVARRRKRPVPLHCCRTQHRSHVQRCCGRRLSNRARSRRLLTDPVVEDSSINDAPCWSVWRCVAIQQGKSLTFIRGGTYTRHS